MFADIHIKVHVTIGKMMRNTFSSHFTMLAKEYSLRDSVMVLEFMSSVDFHSGGLLLLVLKPSCIPTVLADFMKEPFFGFIHFDMLCTLRLKCMYIANVCKCNLLKSRITVLAKIGLLNIDCCFVFPTPATHTVEIV